MDWETIREYMNHSATPYVIGGTVALATGLIGYLMGKRSSPAQLARIDLQKLKENNETELSKLEYIKEDKDNERELRVSELNRKNHLEDKLSERQIDLEDRTYEDAKGKEERDYKARTAVDLASRIAPALAKYMDDLHAQSNKNGNVDPEFLKKRETYRQELVDDYTKSLNNSDGSFAMENVSEDDLNSLQHLVDAKFPLPDSNEDEPELPEQIDELMDFVREFNPKK